MLPSGIGVTRDERLAAAGGDIDAHYALGYFYQNGFKGLEKDDAKAVKLYTFAANRGHADAQNNLSTCFYEGTGGVEQNFKKAFSYLTAPQHEITHLRSTIGQVVMRLVRC